MRMRSLLAAAALAASAIGTAHAANLLPTLDGLPTLKNYKAARSSSTDPNWQDGNGDARPIAPGETLTLAELNGPGRIAHIWFTIADNEREYGKKLVLRMYWDGEKKPSVDSPLNDFFCQGHGMDLKVDSLPFRVTSEGKGRNCYFPMPFGKSARIEVTNEGKEACNALYWYIDWQKMDKLPADTAYFHAKYRQEYPCVSGKDYLILNAVGKGHFVGCNLSVRCNEPGWWGEGDDRFYIDGEEKPSIMGTGSEDYFCDGWGLRQLDGLYYGCTLMEGYDTGQRTTAYRFHIQDPVPFTKSLKVTIEHKGARMMPDGNWNGYVERADDFSSVAYWYQTEPHAEFAKLPPVEARFYPQTGTVIEGESLVATAEAVGPKPTTQELPGWSGGKQLFFTPQDESGSVTLKFNVEKEGKYDLYVALAKSWDYGVYRVFVDGAPAGRKIDLYSPDVALAPRLNLGRLNLTAGEHSLKFQCVGQNPVSSGYYMGLDAITLAPVTK